MNRDEILYLASLSITLAWVAWALVWMIAALGTKPVVYRESYWSRFSYSRPIIASVALLLVGRTSRLGIVLAANPDSGWLYIRFIRLFPGPVLIGAPLVLLGVAITFWARFHLAGNWSGSVTLKKNHELVRSGPYRFVRHPIYTGALVAILGSAFAVGQVRGLLAFALTLAGFWFKSRREERLMLDNFGDAYRSYQDSVKALIPLIF